ncbi:hypothetical protein G6F61_000455 [Rhizopus arrhizus]|nr:hypothetical protein G6F61_000455 [Rhizopus arrhizus]
MYETIKAAVIKRKTKRHLEIEALRTQRFVTTTFNKRLRAEIKSEAISSQSSQSSYEPNTDTSEDEIDDLEPTWNIGEFDKSAVLVGFRKHSLSLHHQFLSLCNLGKMAIDHTFLFDGNDNSKYNCDTSFPPVHLELLSDFNLNECFYQFSNKEHELINDVYYKLATNENGHAEKIVLEHMGNDNLRVCCKVLYNLLQTCTRKVNLQAVDESMYITLSINPFMDVIFGHRCDLSKAGDIIKQYKMDFLVIEVKCPNSNANDDLFKLSIELQILLNRLVNVGIDFPVVFGILVYGKHYIMFVSIYYEAML